MNSHFLGIARKAVAADSLFEVEEIQSLWSGYGAIIRYGAQGGDRESVIVKHVKHPEQANHPRGWNTNLSHQRKVKSYQVESAWYRDYNALCNQHCRTPDCLALEANSNEFLMVLEDLDASGYPHRRESATIEEIHACLRWLAQFHATFMGKAPEGLWNTGTYWHLETRPDELQALEDAALKSAAAHIDQILRDAPYQTFVHGDAKLANFCFSPDGQQVAAVDFQYVGGGCGIKDVAYFIGSCLDEADCERHETQLLDFYFDELKAALVARDIPVDPQEVERAWRPLYPIAWADFHRFLKGWSPGHWKIHSYSERLVRETIARFGT